MSSGTLTMIIFLINFLLVLRFLSSAIMCVYGYEWRKGLIAIMSIYVGLAIGVLGVYLLSAMELSINPILIVTIITFIFFIAAYKIVWLNHFLAGFLVTTKITYMILFILMNGGILEADLNILLGFPLIVGGVAGAILTILCTKQIVLFCLAFIGATELIPKIIDVINKGAFFITGDITYIFDWKEKLLSFLSIKEITVPEVIGILICTAISFIIQKKILDQRGENWSNVILDDKNAEKKDDIILRKKQ